VATDALEHVDDAADRSRISLIRGRVLETNREAALATEAYREAAGGNPRCVEAALAAARLLRSAGDWFTAAELLAAFCNGHPEPDNIELAQVHLALGRLQSGPLENIESAIQSYERALILSPGLHQAREPLAGLLAHVPDRWREAVTQHRELLAAEPTRIGSLRALLEIAERRELAGARAAGLALLRALGGASPTELEDASDRLDLALGHADRLAGEAEETARQICRIAVQEIGDALGQSDPGSAHADFRSALRTAEGELTAPGLCDLPTEDLSAMICTIAALSTDRGSGDPDNPYEQALDRALGRWSRRKIRKQLGGLAICDIQAVDYEAWRDAVRSIAAGIVVERSGGDLRSALIGLTQMARSESGDHHSADPIAGERTDITALVAGCPVANALLGRAVEVWSASIEAA
jgi:tetratricopeptide (TPR) repeat protein